MLRALWSRSGAYRLARSGIRRVGSARWHDRSELGRADAGDESAGYRAELRSCLFLRGCYARSVFSGGPNPGERISPQRLTEAEIRQSHGGANALAVPATGSAGARGGSGAA